MTIEQCSDIAYNILRMEYDDVYKQVEHRLFLLSNEKENDTQFDMVFHCAALVGGRLFIESAPLSVALDLSIDAEFFNWAIRTKPKAVAYFSSSAAYPIV